MIATPATGPFFHRAADRSAEHERFWFFHAPAAPMRGSVLAVHAFAEEMNKTRAAAADGARALAAVGFAVLQIDLAGCGDSAGDFEDATWAGWMADLAEAWAWLGERSAGSRWLWGTRLGALLAEQFASQSMARADGLLLWQPVISGAQHLNQFLRLKTVGSLLRNTGSVQKNEGTSASMSARMDANTSTAARVVAPSPRADLAAGLTVEIAGYRLNPSLADAIESAQMGQRETAPAVTPLRVRWFEVSSQPSATLSPIAARVADRWRTAGSDIRVAIVVGNAFWQTQEIERCDALVDASVNALCA